MYLRFLNNVFDKKQTKNKTGNEMENVYLATENVYKLS